MAFNSDTTCISLCDRNYAVTNRWIGYLIKIASLTAITIAKWHEKDNHDVGDNDDATANDDDAKYG